MADELLDERPAQGTFITSISRGLPPRARMRRAVHIVLFTCLVFVTSIPTRAITLAGDDSTAARPSRVQVMTGVEVEGLEQSLGEASLFPGAVPPAGSPGDIEEALRFHERETDLMGVAGAEIASADGPGWAPLFSIEAKAGHKRRVLTSVAELALRKGALRGFSVQNLLSWDEQSDGHSTGQDMLYLRLRRPMPGTGMDIISGASFDLSWAKGDTLAALFDYRRAGLRLGVAGRGFGQPAATLDFSHRWENDEGRGAYDAASLDCSRGWMFASGTLDLGARAERRIDASRDFVADDSASAVAEGSYWETEITGRLSRNLGIFGVDGTARLSGTLFDESPVEEIDLATYADRFRIELDLLARKPIVGGHALGGGRPWFESLEAGLGPVLDIIRLRGSDGDFNAAGGKLEISAAGGARLGNLWLDLSGEIGRRDYRGDGGAIVFDYQGLTFSLAQSDFTYFEISAIGGGALPYDLEWEGYFSLDQEEHDVAADNGKLVSFSLALKHRWNI